MRYEEYSRMKDWKRKKKFSLNSWKSKIVIREIVKTIYFVREIVEMKKIVREIVNWPLPGGVSLTCSNISYFFTCVMVGTTKSCQSGCTLIFCFWCFWWPLDPLLRRCKNRREFSLFLPRIREFSFFLPRFREFLFFLPRFRESYPLYPPPPYKNK